MAASTDIEHVRIRSSDLTRPDHNAEAVGAPSQAGVEGHEPATQMHCQGQILGVVGLGPAEVVGKLPSHLAQPAVGARAYRVVLQPVRRAQGVRT
jgi:hypothetical protein